MGTGEYQYDAVAGFRKGRKYIDCYDGTFRAVGRATKRTREKFRTRRAGRGHMDSR